MKTDIDEDKILMLLNDVTIKEEELSCLELNYIEKKKLNKDIIIKVSHKLSVKKKWLAVAASLALICIGLFVCRPALAANTVAVVNSLIFGQNKGMEKAVKNNYIQAVAAEPVYSNGIEVQMTNILIDKTKIAMSFNLKFTDLKLLENIHGISLDMQVKDEWGRALAGYLDEDYTNKKILNVITSSTDNFEFINKDNGLVKYNIIFNSQNGDIPKLHKLIVNIKSVNYFNRYSEGKINGTWQFSTDVSDKFMNETGIEFTSGKSGTDISIKSAETTATGTLIIFTAPKNKKINMNKDLQLIDDKGNSENVAGVSNMEDGIFTATYSVTFPVTIYDNPNSLTLVIKNYTNKDLKIKLQRK